MPVISLYTTDPQVRSGLMALLAALDRTGLEPVRAEAFSDFAAFLDSGRRHARRILMLAQAGTRGVELAATTVEECPESSLVWLSDLDFALYAYHLEVAYFGMLPGTEEMLRAALRSCRRERPPGESWPAVSEPPPRNLWQKLIRWICLKD